MPLDYVEIQYYKEVAEQLRASIEFLEERGYEEEVESAQDQLARIVARIEWDQYEGDE